MEHDIGTAAQTSDLTESQQWIENLHDRARRPSGKSSVTKRGAVRGHAVPHSERGIRAGPPTVGLNTAVPINVTDIDRSRQRGQTANCRLL